ncbi:P-II family nitrogen regulator [Amphritea sp. 1_MG-2023]|uniref:P-II family nitrogen regulator n=1 Tax=Amphritea sp. 1_MG-2023 TaxID=3062670 RepID=UPI0026E3A2A9|nr:P-II family nitrogen regulator [Amphritea sp. 1_MG-2023]MDO6564986.1 P-II family nitrogen regulator [Amphritea sp. 1_MG-2023]
MKLIAAIIRPHILDEVRAALQSLGVRGLTITEVQGYGQQHNHTEYYRGTEYLADFKPKLKVEATIDDALLEPVINAVSGIAQSGFFGDGKLFISQSEQVFRIRTGESGVFAL